MDVDLDYLSLRKRADQCRFLASEVRDESIRDRLLAIASDYEKLATRSENKPFDLARRMANRKRDAWS